MLRVLHVVMGMNRGGIETMIMNIYRKIDRKKLQFDFLVHTTEEMAFEKEIKELGGKVYSVRPRSKGIRRNQKDLHNFFKNHPEYNIIHQHASSLTYIEPLRIAKKYNINHRIIHGHSTQQGGLKIHQVLHSINQKRIKNISTIKFACTKDAAYWMYGKDYSNFTIIYNGIDTNDFRYNVETRESIRNEFNIENDFVIGHVGRFTHQKNHDFIIDVFSEIVKRDSNAKLMLVGDGKLKNKIIEKLNKKNLINKVILTGVVPNSYDYLNSMDVFLFPSLNEGLGMVAIEAQATGLKCFITSDLPTEVNVTENIQRVPLLESPEIWAKEILKYKNGYLRRDQSQLIKEKGFDISETAKKLENYYFSLNH